jgi:hypothetical protein
LRVGCTCWAGRHCSRSDRKIRASWMRVNKKRMKKKKSRVKKKRRVMMKKRTRVKKVVTILDTVPPRSEDVNFGCFKRGFAY